MPIYEYKCFECDTFTEIIKSMEESQTIEKCPQCGKDTIRIISQINISGTRDSFGIKNAFTDPESGKEISTWKEWEQAGYKQLKDSPGKKRRNICNEKIKEKKAKLKNRIMV